jgi:hypothetical protein
VNRSAGGWSRSDYDRLSAFESRTAAPVDKLGTCYQTLAREDWEQHAVGIDVAGLTMATLGQRLVSPSTVAATANTMENAAGALLASAHLQDEHDLEFLPSNLIVTAARQPGHAGELARAYAREDEVAVHAHDEHPSKLAQLFEFKPRLIVHAPVISPQFVHEISERAYADVAKGMRGPNLPSA